MLSICIALKNRSRVVADGTELRLFPNCVSSIVQSVLGVVPTELVVADWESDDWPLQEWLTSAAAPLPVHIAPQTGAFSRGRGLNEAAGLSMGEMLFFTDADSLLCPELIRDGIACLNQGKAFFPVLYSFDSPDHRSGWWRHEGYGNCMISRELYEKSGGWPQYAQWGKEDVDFRDRVLRVAEVVREEVPGFFHQWHPEDILWKDRYAQRREEDIEEIKQVRVAIQELTQLVRPGETLILVDEARFGIDKVDGCRVRPFLERGGEYAGPPSDDAAAIAELRRMREAGATLLVVAWMAQWWLDYYTGLRDYLSSNFPLLLKNERLTVFDIRT